MNGTSRFSRLIEARNRYIYNKITAWQDRELKEAVPSAQGLPVTLRGQGLVVTMARLESSETGAGSRMAGMIREWLTQDMPMDSPVAGSFLPGEFIQQLLDMDRPDYLALQAEAISFCECLKLITKAVFKGKEA